MTENFRAEENVPSPPAVIPYIRCSFILTAEWGSSAHAHPQQGGYRNGGRLLQVAH